MNGVPNGIRTHVLAVKGQCPRPLDYGDAQRADCAYQIENLQYILRALRQKIKIGLALTKSSVSKMQKPRTWTLAALATSTLGALLTIYAVLVEPVWIEVTHHEVVLGLSRALTVAQLSDLHVENFGRREKKLLTLLKQENPDVIVLTGDLITDKADYASLAKFLKELHAPLGVWGVQGNWDLWKGPPSPDFFEKLHVQWLVNRAKPLTTDLWILGFDDETGKPAPRGTLAQVPIGVRSLALFHSPQFFDVISSRIDLALAGHTHAGQVRLPWMGPLWLPYGSGRFVEGWYGSPRGKLYVSRGVGTSVLPIRFNCRPEVPIFHLR
jgi:uncharacterized protein